LESGCTEPVDPGSVHSTTSAGGGPPPLTPPLGPRLGTDPLPPVEVLAQLGEDRHSFGGADVPPPFLSPWPTW
jgi:hypothetical protein